MYKYRNKSDRDLMVVGVGTVKAGTEVETSVLIENPNFELISAQDEALPQLPAAAPAPELPQAAAPAQLPAPAVNEGITE